MKYILKYDDFISEFLVDEIVEQELEFAEDFYERRFLLNFTHTNYFTKDEQEFLTEFLNENDTEFLNENELEFFYGDDELLLEGFRSLLKKTGNIFARAGTSVGRGVAGGTKSIGRGAVIAGKGIGRGVAKGTIVAGKGIGRTTIIAAKGIKKGASVVGSGVAKNAVVLAKSTSSVAKSAADKVMKAARAIKLLITASINEFDKAYLFFTNTSKKDIQVSAAWTLKKYPQIRKAAAKATGEEKSYLESAINFLSKDIYGKIRNIFIGAIKKNVNESLLYDEDGYVLITEVENLLTEDHVALKVINKAHNYVEKDKIDTGLPKGFWSKFWAIVSKSLDAIDSILDTLYKTRTRLTLASFAAGVKMLGGPTPPKDGFPNTSMVYTLSGIHTHGGDLGNGTIKNWKHSLGYGIRKGINRVTDVASAMAMRSIGAVSLGAPYLLKLIKIIKKIQITALILKISAGEVEPIKLNKSTGGSINDLFDKNKRKNWFDKNAE